MDTNLGITVDATTGLKIVSWNFSDSTGSFTYDDLVELQVIGSILDSLRAIEYATMYDEETAVEAVPYND